MGGNPTFDDWYPSMRPKDDRDHLVYTTREQPHVQMRKITMKIPRSPLSTKSPALEAYKKASSAPETKVSRPEVFAALNAEREYQQKKYGGDAPRSVPEFLVYMQDYLTEAIRQATRDPDDAPLTCSLSTLDTVRKITALGVACMEQHGAPPRAIVKGKVAKAPIRKRRS